MIVSSIRRTQMSEILAAERFIDLYPTAALPPYQTDLIIQIFSGHAIRTRGGTSAHVGGANRTIIKIAQ